MRITLLHAVGDDAQGAVLDVDERRATRLVRTGYAVAAPPVSRKEKREEPWPSKA